jgi:hypothetical protein
LQYTGAAFENCLFDGGTDGVKSNGLVDFVRCVNCYSNASGTGFNLNDAGNGAKSSLICGSIAEGCSIGFSVSGGCAVDGCITSGCTDAIQTTGSCRVKSTVLYDCGSHAFICSNTKARWEIVNCIVVLNQSADGVFGVGSGGGSIVFEDYNCFCDTAGNPVTLHDNANWPIDYVPSALGVHSIQVNPAFVDVSHADFSLQGSSPCQDTGKPTLFAGVTSMGVWQPQQVSDPGQSGGGGGRHHGRFGGTGRMQY